MLTGARGGGKFSSAMRLPPAAPWGEVGLRTGLREQTSRARVEGNFLPGLGSSGTHF